MQDKDFYKNGNGINQRVKVDTNPISIMEQCKAESILILSRLRLANHDGSKVQGCRTARYQIILKS